VERDLRCQGGSPATGSVLVASPVDRVHGITSAILCRGNFRSRYGIHPAMDLEGLLTYAAAEKPALKPIRNALSVFAHVMPLFGRVVGVGPFEARTCWFADYSTSILLVWVKKAYIPVPFPLPNENCLKSLFSGLSWFSAGQLNLRLGPYFYTQGRGWLYGRGVVPIMLKAHPDKFLGDLERRLSHFPPIELKHVIESLRKFMTDISLGMARSFVVEFSNSVVLSIFNSKIPFIPVKCFPWKEGKLRKPVEIEAFIYKIMNLFARRLRDSLNHFFIQIRQVALREYRGNPKTMLREVPGLFLYTGRDAIIGSDPGTSLLASGLFVCRGNLTFRTSHSVGVAISLMGNIYAENFHHYPFFSNASLYNPLKPSEFEMTLGGAEAHSILPLDEIRDILYLSTPIRRGPGLDFLPGGSRVISQGWLP